ncbi:MAG: DUF3991 domain-containing protein [Oscillospiraceae bacterium]
MYYSGEQIRRANLQSITDFFARRGYACDREGKEIHIHGFGGLKVKEETKEYYIHSRHVGGVGLVGCLMDAFEIPFPEAVQMALYGEEPGEEHRTESKAYEPYHKKSEPKPFVIPEPAENNRRVFAYLSKERCISPDVINELIHSGLLYQDKNGNAVFLHRRGNTPCGAEIHGTSRKKYVIGNTHYADIRDKKILSVEPYEAELLGRFLKNTGIAFSGYVYPDEANIVSDSSNFKLMNDMAELISNMKNTAELQQEVQKKLKNFKGVAPGTTGSYFEYDRGFTEKAYVFESAIDLMSFMQLHSEANNCKFVAMAGLKPTVVEDLLSKGLKVVLCVDNDDAGMEFCRRFAGRCLVFTECRKNGVKDFNELLQKRFPKKDFFGVVRSMSQWSEKVIKQEIAREVRYETYGNRSI